MGDLLTLESPELRVVVDPGRGSDILSIAHPPTGTELLFTTPWRPRADALRAGGGTAALPPEQWLEHYRGGWQTLCPNAGPPRTSDEGAPYGFHGEASVVAWEVVAASPRSARLAVDLFTAPVRIERTLSVEAGRLSLTDAIVNTSRRDVSIDYSHHPAFGGPFLEDGLALTTAARTFTADPDARIGGVEPGSVQHWPRIDTDDGPRDASLVPAAPAPAALFGWLGDFERGEASLTSAARGITATLEWDAALLPYAWVWQELNSSDDFPWFGRARVMAIEPASTPTSGPGRARSLTVPAGERIVIDIALTVAAAADGVSTHGQERQWDR
jgi:hypothetical protein